MDTPVIIEFNGLPATGKTTVASSLMSLLEDKKINVQNNFMKKGHTNTWSLIFELDCVIVLFWSIFFAVSLKPLRNRMKYAAVMALHYRKYRDFLEGSENGVLVIDQGFIQSVVSVAYGDSITNMKCISKLFKFLKNKQVQFIRVDCINDVDLSYQRLRNRVKNSSRLHTVVDDKVKLILNTQKENFEVIRSVHTDVFQTQIVRIDTSRTSIDNARYIYDKLLNNKI